MNVLASLSHPNKNEVSSIALSSESSHHTIHHRHDEGHAIAACVPNSTSRMATDESFETALDCPVLRGDVHSYNHEA